MDLFVKVNISVQIFKDEGWLSMLFIKPRSYRTRLIIEMGTKSNLSPIKNVLVC